MTAVSEAATTEMGAYGLRVAGLAGATSWMQPQAPGAPLLRVQVERGEPDPSPSHLDADSADLRLIDGGRLRAVRGRDTVLYRFPKRPPDPDLLHPYLAPAVALRWQWAGLEALHAGAFATPRGAVLVLGDKGAGKSTTLAWLAVNLGTTVLTDDLAVVNAKTVLTGPRSIDLRSEALEVIPESRFVRGDKRLRVGLRPAPSCLDLAGVVVLVWGHPTATIPVPVADRLPLLTAQRTYPGLAADPVALLELGSVPMVRLRRPHDLSSLAAVGSALAREFD